MKLTVGLIYIMLLTIKCILKEKKSLCHQMPISVICSGKENASGEAFHRTFHHCSLELAVQGNYFQILYRYKIKY